MSFVNELQWRGMIHDIMPGTEEQFTKEMTAAYVGVDPTADSLHIGHLVSIMMLKHLQIAGHKPIALIGGATGMVGDPSGKSKERNMLSIDELRSNEAGLAKQMAKFLDFDCGENSALLLNNYDWFKDFDFLGFLREVGKHISVNYMMSKDSVKKRLETGISFTEFSYQLLQGYDFYHLNKEHNCKLQMGGSDQWGNITTGTELVRRKGGGDAFALTCPLITKADGGKFGKTESGNVWLDPERTSPYQFYQFWLNCSDEDAAKYIKIFTLFSKDEIEQLEAEHAEAPHLRVVQKALAKDITIRVHSEEDYNTAIEASNILFGKSTKESLLKVSEQDFLSIFDGVPQFEVAKADIDTGVNILELVAISTKVFPSKGEARKMIKANGFSLNKEKLTDENTVITCADLLNNKYLLLQKGKKNYFLVKVV